MLQACRATPGWQLIHPIDGKIVCPFCQDKITPQLRKDRTNVGWNLGNVKRHLIDYCSSTSKQLHVDLLIR